MADTIDIGLQNVVAGQTAISDIDGERGELRYRGVPIETLVDWPFAKAAWWVLFGDAAGGLDSLQWQQLEPLLIERGRLTPKEKRVLEQLPRQTHPMLMLQSLIPIMALPTDNATPLPTDNEQASAALTIAAKIPTLIANWNQLRTNGTTVDYIDAGSFHGNFLWMFTGRQPSGEACRLLDVTQILQLEHGYNAGTFAGRVVASTQAPIQSVIAASIGALFGRLHGGADQAALEMAEKIGTPEHAREYVQQTLASKQKIMGMGHREYQVVDPRARILKPLAQHYCREDQAKRLLDILIAVEQSCQEEFALKQQQIWANVEFYKGAVFHSLGITPEFFTAIFAMARVFGYIAHYFEFQQAPRLIRPKAVYVGL